MSILPTKVLLATDGSEDAALATRTAIDLCNQTDSELRVVTVAGVEYRPGYDIPESGDLLSEVYRSLEREAQELLDGQVKKIEEAGGTVAQAYLRSGRRDRDIVSLEGVMNSTEKPHWDADSSLVRFSGGPQFSALVSHS